MNLVSKVGMPMTSTGLVLHNLSRLLDKKESTLKEIESILGALIGANSDEGTVRLDRILLDWILINCSDYCRSTTNYEQHIETRPNPCVNI